MSTWKLFKPLDVSTFDFLSLGSDAVADVLTSDHYRESAGRFTLDIFGSNLRYSHGELLPFGDISRIDLFDSLVFWGSWKWTGWFATDFTWVGRWIMLSVVKKDVRAVNLCIEWIRDRHFPEHGVALRGALSVLTGESHDSNADWLRWYDGVDGNPGARVRYPEPDVNAWFADLKAQAK